MVCVQGQRLLYPMEFTLSTAKFASDRGAINFKINKAATADGFASSAASYNGTFYSAKTL